jgi:hypothetical protein
MADDRPAPRYGELAPEGWVWSPPSDPDAATSDDGTRETRPAPSTESAASDAEAKPYRLADASFSVFLLVTALMLTTSSVPSLFGLRSTIERFYSDRGLGQYGGGPAVDIAGSIAAVSHLVLLAAAIWLTVRLIGQRRRSWPVPLLLGALAMIITFGCVIVALVADPGLLSSISSS